MYCIMYQVMSYLPGDLDKFQLAFPARPAKAECGPLTNTGGIGGHQDFQLSQRPRIEMITSLASGLSQEPSFSEP
jgi:hypothetical protein